jgi:hypothetical protein
MNEKLKDVGLVEAIVKFSGQFSLKKTEDVVTMRTQKTLRLYQECEDEFWMVMVNVFQIILINSSHEYILDNQGSPGKKRERQERIYRILFR